MLQVDPIQSYLNLKIGLPPVLKAGSSGNWQNLKKTFVAGQILKSNKNYLLSA